MKKNIIISIVILLFLSCTFKDPKRFTGRTPPKYPFFIYSDKDYPDYYCLSGIMGDISDMRILKEIDPVSSKKTMIISYKPSGRAKSMGWAGFYWQYPPNNWGKNDRGGFNFSKARYLYFFARGSKGGELINFKIGGVTGTYGDTDTISSGIIKLTKYWKIYKMKVDGFDMNNIISAFGVLFSSKLNGDGVVNLLDFASLANVWKWKQR